MKWFIIGLCCGILIGYGIGNYNKPTSNIKYIYKKDKQKKRFFIYS